MADIKNCKNCGKPENDHQSSTKDCPVGKKHRTLGYSQFSTQTKFEEKPKKKIKSRSAKNKGRELQNYVAQKISELLEIPYGQDELIESRGMGQNGTDVRLSGEARKLFPFSIECKCGCSFSFPAAIKQAKDNQLPNTDWLVVTRRDREKAVVSVDAETFFKIMKELHDYRKKT